MYWSKVFSFKVHIDLFQDWIWPAGVQTGSHESCLPNKMADIYQAYPTPLTRKKKKKKKNREGMLHVMVAEKYIVDFLLFFLLLIFIPRPTIVAGY